MSKYQITLTPIDKFFFGGDMTFMVGKNEKDEYNEKFSSYIIHSSMFPQQTSLLGMLRFLILRNSGEDVFKNGAIVNKSKAGLRIGKSSFTVNENHNENEFGFIKSISHVWIRRHQKGEFCDLEIKPLYEGPIAFEEASSGTYNAKSICIPEIPDYKAKDGLEVRVSDGGKLEDLFTKDRRVGINRNIKDGKTEDNALFKQVSYRFTNKDQSQHCFVFNAEIDDTLSLDKYSGIVSIGGDNSQFVIKISKDVKYYGEIKPVKNAQYAVYAISPMFIAREEAQKAKFAITQLLPFRFLESKMENVDSYHILSKQLKRSEKYRLPVG